MLNTEKIELFPKEIYLIEQFISYEYYYETVKLWEELIQYAEDLLDRYSANLAPDHRAQHPSHQADYVWGTIVLPNFKATLHHLLDGMEDLKEGFLPVLGRMSSIRNDLIAQGRDYPYDWMEQVEKGAVETYKEKESIVLTRANNIYISSDYSMQWEYKDLLDDLELAVGLTYMTGSVNYKLNNTVMVKTGEPILQTGIYRSIEAFSSCKFLMQEKNTYTNMVGEWVTAPQVYAFKQDPDTYTRENYEYAQLIDTTWILVERATDTNDANIILNNLKISQKSGEKATKTGYWKTPAQPDKQFYFVQGEIFPILKNADWGEVYWYFDGEQ